MQANFSYGENYFRMEATPRRKPLRFLSLSAGQESCGLLSAAETKIDVASRENPTAKAAGTAAYGSLVYVTLIGDNDDGMASCFLLGAELVGVAIGDIAGSGGSAANWCSMGGNKISAAASVLNLTGNSAASQCKS